MFVQVLLLPNMVVLLTKQRVCPLTMATAVAADMVNGSVAGRRMTDRLTESQFKSPGQETQESRKGPCQEVLATAGAEQGIPTNQSEIFVIENSGIITTS